MVLVMRQLADVSGYLSGQLPGGDLARGVPWELAGSLETCPRLVHGGDLSGIPNGGQGVVKSVRGAAAGVFWVSCRSPL